MKVDLTIDYSNGCEKRFRTEATHPQDLRVFDILTEKLGATTPGVKVELTEEGSDRGGGLFGWIKTIDDYPPENLQSEGRWAVWVGSRRIRKLFAGFNRDVPGHTLPPEGGFQVLLKFVSDEQGDGQPTIAAPAREAQDV